VILSNVWRVLRQMGWSRQRPARRSAERDDEAIEQWVNERWPK
jgi:putative transposase